MFSDWVYCKYHYQEGHEFSSSELELRHFLRKIIEPDWKFSQQYEPDAHADKEKEIDECECWTLAVSRVINQFRKNLSKH